MTNLGAVREALGGNVDTVSVRGGVFTVRREFFYTHGHTSAGLAGAVLRLVPGATVLDHGEVWKPFRGGASTARSSHWWVTFAVKPAEAGIK